MNPLGRAKAQATPKTEPADAVFFIFIFIFIGEVRSKQAPKEHGGRRRLYKGVPRVCIYLSCP